MKKTLVIEAHPHLHDGSRANLCRVEALRSHSNITVHSLYEVYPDWTIDTKDEQQLLLDHDRIVLQYPLYWYSVTPLLKKWFDDVLEYGWAYGSKGVQLQGKQFILAITAGGTLEDYQAGGSDWFSISEYTKPLQATIVRCRGTFLPSWITYDADQLTEKQLQIEAAAYVNYIQDQSLKAYKL
ncbi:NAD(P)H-dependent oxidoreductase [Aureibacillus halotolerans]|uniref:Glutathione-regulated potassium-efflux system ancillary protein KefG n=1 Tax=Aureibacillus halotolerans TaxID=1508390 RepID=A0A4R6U1Z7_9BACI|nr:NAD(P)H-dependent oxidoreductase [Aureibacillus halotolerans]TDQ40360.1 glutathione-regulated potassium-efflux system ancillary protein KefG [Aureibacillus halotolerans]